MTDQISEILHYQGRKQRMCTEPLGDYFALASIEPRFEVSCTALWRGYVGEWEIREGRLYLVKLTGTLEGDTPATLETFPPVFQTECLRIGTAAKCACPWASSLNTSTAVTPAPTSKTC
jgi:hypothetical protein